VRIFTQFEEKSSPESQGDLVLEDDFFGEFGVGIDLFIGEQNIAPILLTETLQLSIK
jgi:hypothetical protein